MFFMFTLVMRAVRIPIRAPIPTDPNEMVKKLKIVRKNASTSKESGSPEIETLASVILKKC